MKALITAGGRGTRLRPITHTINKHLIPIAGQPMIFYAIEKVAQAGVREIYINTNEGETEVQKVVGKGSRWGVTIKFFEQKGGPRGIADVVRQAQRFIGASPFILYLGDNIILASIKKFVGYFKKEKLNCFLALSKVPNPSHFGVPLIEKNRIMKVVEKPSCPTSPYAVTGIYIYDKNIWPAIKQLKPSARGELEISDVHTWLIKKGLKVGYREITGWWKDTGRSENLLEANQLLLNQMKKKLKGEVEKTVSVQGMVEIGKGTKIQGQSVIRGPVVIGKNCMVKNSYIGPFSSIGNQVEIYGAEIENSIIFDEADIHTNARIVDSLIGVNSTIVSSCQSLPSGHKLVVGSNSMVEL
jgi:glucose-1-phosphate thymidylyltransferase